MERVRPKISLFIVFIIFAAFFFGSGFLIGKDFKTIYPGVPLKLEKAVEVYQKLQKDYIFKDSIDREKLEYGAAKGLVDAVGDPYTYFFDPKEAKEFNETFNGGFEGIGAEIGLNEDRDIVIIAPLEGSPAKKAGLSPQDIILQINDKPAVGLTLDAAVGLIKGPKGTTVTLAIKRERLPEPIKISIVREIIEIPTIKWKLLEGNNIAYIQLYNFNENVGELFANIAQEILSSKAYSIILDLRANPGGYLDEAVKIGGWFIDKEAIIASEKFADGTLQYSTSNGPAKFKGFPLVILIDKGSASASEILAGALKYHSNAILVGEKTFGKGTVQILEPFRDGSMLKVTRSQWLLPNGRSIHKEGIMPDELIVRNGQEDEQLKKAIEILTK